MRAIFIGGAALLALSACGGPASETERGNAAGAAASGAAPVTATAAGDLIPAYPGAVAVEVPNLGVAGTDSRSGNARASETDDSIETVARYYRERFAAAGIPIRVDSVTATGGVMGIGRDGEQGALLTITRPGARTRITAVQRR